MKGLVLAGGESRRFGTNKALAKVNGDKQTLLERSFRLLTEHIGETWISCRREHISIYSGVTQRLLVDASSSAEGPSAGFRSAYEKFPFDSWFVLACDYPHVDAACVETLCKMWLKLEGDEQNCDALVFLAPKNGPKGKPKNRSDGCAIFEPLIGIWSGRALAQFDTKHAISPQQALRELNTVGLDCPNPKWLINLNWDI